MSRNLLFIKKGLGITVLAAALTCLMPVSTLAEMTTDEGQYVTVDTGQDMQEGETNAQLPGKAIADLNLENGIYTMEVEMTGGAAGIGIVSPMRVQILDGNMTALVEWDSQYYTMLDFGDYRFYPEKREGNSKFKIPIPYTDAELPMYVWKTEFDQSYETECFLTFRSDTAVKAESNKKNGLTTALTAFGGLFAVMGAATFAMMVLHKKIVK